jgi:hypothetical protein
MTTIFMPRHCSRWPYRRSCDLDRDVGRGRSPVAKTSTNAMVSTRPGGAAEDTGRGPNAGRSATSVPGAQVADRASRLITGELPGAPNTEVT